MSYKKSKCKKIEQMGLRMAAPRKIGPKVIVYDVPNKMTSEKFLNEFYEKNAKEVCQKVSLKSE